MRKRVLKMHPSDVVATAIDAVKAGDSVAVCTKDGAQVDELNALEDIELYHKLALVDLAEHDLVRKYGEIIGEATQPIKRGAHVHVHNIASVKTRSHD